MTFELYIRKTCTGASDVATRQLMRNVAELSKSLSKSISTSAWEDGYSASEDVALGLCKSIAKYAAICDAVEIINEKLFRTKLSEVHDIKIEWEFSRTISHLRSMVERNDIPNRGYIYVLWNSRSERIYALGEQLSANVADLKDAVESSIAEYSPTDLVLIYPSSSRQQSLSLLVDGIAEIVGFVQPEFISNFGKPNRVDSRVVGDVVVELQRLLVLAADRLSASPPNHSLQARQP